MITWELCNTRRLAVPGALAWNRGIGKHFKERYGTGIFNTITYFDGKRTDYFFDQEQHQLFNQHIDGEFSNREFVLSMIPEAKETLEEKYELIKLLLLDYQNWPGQKLGELFEKVLFFHGDFYPRKWMAYRICHRIDLQIEKVLKKAGKSEEEIAEFLRVLSVPLKPNYVMMEKVDLLQIAIQKESFTAEELKKELQAHTEKYKHMPLFDFDHDPYDLEHFSRELEHIKKPQEELKKIQENFKIRTEEFEKVIQQLNSSNTHEQFLINKNELSDSTLCNSKVKFQDLLSMLKKAVFFRDYADTVRQKLNFHLRRFYSDLGSKIGLLLDEVVLLTDQELLYHLKNGIVFDQDELSRRKESFLLKQIGDNVSIISGTEAK
ncbi:hypothetical protein HYX12_00620, partial [Candidatus Woesearchaeota archaeon]|nr:hypothetical protein [Candidatus Woesearchaeota archaeon]